MAEEESPSKKLRIYVGGLGAAMTDDDLRKLFHSVGGVVEAVDFIRTKSRSFAYVDFSPSSQSSLSKLFSTVRFSARFHCRTLISLFPCPDFSVFLLIGDGIIPFMCLTPYLVAILLSTSINVFFVELDGVFLI